MIWGNFAIYAERNVPGSGMPVNGTIFMQSLRTLLKREITMTIHQDNGLISQCGNTDFGMRLHESYWFCFETEVVE